MAKFRKRPVVIEAIPCSHDVQDDTNNWQNLPEWLRAAYDKGGVVFTPKGVHLPTLEGTMFANYNDWIICGVKGEVYPCKDDIFKATYEPIEN